jgi:hypothetical protein
VRQGDAVAHLGQITVSLRAVAARHGIVRRAAIRSRARRKRGLYVVSMSTVHCEVCGNTYDKAFEVVLQGQSHVFDSFECAIQALAPRCAHCGCRVIGHGMEKGAKIFCCAHCATSSGVTELRDRG